MMQNTQLILNGLSLNTQFDVESTLLEQIWIDPELSGFKEFHIQVNGGQYSKCKMCETKLIK